MARKGGGGERGKEKKRRGDDKARRERGPSRTGEGRKGKGGENLLQDGASRRTNNTIR